MRTRIAVIALASLLVSLLVTLSMFAAASRVEAAPAAFETQEFPLPSGAGPHDVAPAIDGGVWYTAQAGGALGYLDPSTGESQWIRLSLPNQRAAPHGVIVGPDGAPWITDGGLNAIVRVDPATHEIQRFPLPAERRAANLNTATFDRDGMLWFTGQSGVYGRLNPIDGSMDVWDAPRGSGPYGITTTPSGDVYFASLASSYIARIDRETGAATPIDPPTTGQGARRVWSDSRGRIWVSEWNAGQLGLYDPSTGAWREWKLPGASPQAYAVYVDDQDVVWLSDFGANALVRFDPARETFDVLPFARSNASARQIAGRTGEIWAAESSLDRLIVVRTR
jgi:virginiamycin B lyase